jgi:hypothetical protein
MAWRSNESRVIACWCGSLSSSSSCYCVCRLGLGQMISRRQSRRWWSALGHLRLLRLRHPPGRCRCRFRSLNSRRACSSVSRTTTTSAFQPASTFASSVAEREPDQARSGRVGDAGYPQRRRERKLPVLHFAQAWCRLRAQHRSPRLATLGLSLRSLPKRWSGE